MLTVNVMRSLLAAMVLMGSVGQARAEDSNPEVEGLIRQGIKLREQHQEDQALAVFRKAYGLERSARTLAHMGLAEEQLAAAAAKAGLPDARLWESADDHLTAALGEPDGTWLRKFRSGLQGELTKVRLHTGELSIRGTPGAVVYIAGLERGTLPLPVPLRVGAGEANLQVSTPGRQPLNTTIRVVPGQVLRVEAQLEPADGPAPRPVLTQQAGVPRQAVAPRADTAEPASWNASRVVGWSLVAAGTASAAVGALLLRNRDSECHASSNQMCVQLGRPSSGPGWAFIGGGAAAAALGGVLIFVSRDVQVAALPSPHAFVLTAKGTL